MRPHVEWNAAGYGWNVRSLSEVAPTCHRLMSRHYASMGLDVGMRACVLPTGKSPPLTPLEELSSDRVRAARIVLQLEHSSILSLVLKDLGYSFRRHPCPSSCTRKIGLKRNFSSRQFFIVFDFLSVCIFLLYFCMIIQILVRSKMLYILHVL